MFVRYSDQYDLSHFYLGLVVNELVLRLGLDLPPLPGLDVTGILKKISHQRSQEAMEY
jgi:hypothetical protein